MASRKPLVIGADGLPQQLQTGDDLAGVTVSANPSRTVTNGESSAALVIGTPCYMSAAGTAKKAQASSKTLGSVMGLIVDTSIAAGATGTLQTDGVFVATTTQWDAITGGTGGLTFAALYFLDPATAGKLTTTPPTTAGQVNTLIGRAMSTTELDMSIQPPILL